MLHDGIFIILRISLYIFSSFTLNDHSLTESYCFLLWNVFEIHPFSVLNASVLVHSLLNPYQDDCNKLLFFPSPISL